jgi:hypothetical protein
MFVVDEATCPVEVILNSTRDMIALAVCAHPVMLYKQASIDVNHQDLGT